VSGAAGDSAERDLTVNQRIARTAVGLLCAALTLLASAGCLAQSSFPVRRSFGSDPFEREHRCTSLTDRSVSRDLRLGSAYDVFADDCLFEMHRLFQASPNLGYSAGRILKKAVLALALLQDDNTMELAVRPQRDIISSLGRRSLIRQYRRGTRVAPPEGKIAIDTHLHTCASPDSLASASEILLSAACYGLNGVAITDHDTLDGATRAIETAEKLKAQGRLPASFLVIPGEEVSSSDGHIIGLFLTATIPPGMTAERTVQAIHNQGGLAIAAHPLRPKSLEDLANTLPFDAVETETAAENLHYAITPGVDRARRAAFYAGVTKPRIGASDSHDPESVAECYTILQCELTLEGVREAILAGRTTPVAAITDDYAKVVADGTLPRLLSIGWALTDLSPVIRKYLHTDDISLSILPRPALRFSKQF